MKNYVFLLPSQINYLPLPSFIAEPYGAQGSASESRLYTNNSSKHDNCQTSLNNSKENIYHDATLNLASNSCDHQGNRQYQREGNLYNTNSSVIENGSFIIEKVNDDKCESANNCAIKNKLVKSGMESLLHVLFSEKDRSNILLPSQQHSIPTMTHGKLDYDKARESKQEVPFNNLDITNGGKIYSIFSPSQPKDNNKDRSRSLTSNKITLNKSNNISLKNIHDDNNLSHIKSRISLSNISQRVQNMLLNNSKYDKIINRNYNPPIKKFHISTSCEFKGSNLLPTLQVVKKDGWYGLNDSVLTIYQQLERDGSCDKVKVEIIPIDLVPQFLINNISKSDYVCNGKNINDVSMHSLSRTNKNRDITSRLADNTLQFLKSVLHENIINPSIRINKTLNKDIKDEIKDDLESKVSEEYCFDSLSENTDSSDINESSETDDEYGSDFSTSTEESDLDVDSKFSYDTYVCKICDHYFESGQEFMKHQQKKKHFWCGICNVNLVSMKMLNLHKIDCNHRSDKDSLFLDCNPYLTSPLIEYNHSYSKDKMDIETLI
ncbi:unnamed protein product [Gordionus sp. m RMFG-2023]